MALSAKPYSGSGTKTEPTGAAKPPAGARLTSSASDRHALGATIGAGRMDLQSQAELEIVPSPEAVAAVTGEVAAEIAATAAVEAPAADARAGESSEVSTTLSDEQLEEGLHFSAPSTGDGLAGVSLLELAEVLDQHRLWIDSGGESGA